MYTCFLCGLIIPPGKLSVEHYCPKSRVDPVIANSSLNKFPAHRTINNIKGDLLPCEWEELKWNLCYRASHFWHIKTADKKYVEAALKNWETYTLDPCKFCLLHCKQRG